MPRPTCISSTFWPFVWSWLFLNKLFTLCLDNFSSEIKGHRQYRTLENVSQEMENQKTQGIHRKIRPTSTVLTFFNCTRNAIKKSEKIRLQKYTFQILSSLEKIASLNFDWGYISLCQLTVHSFNCKIQVNIFCVCVCLHYLMLECCCFNSEMNYSSVHKSSSSHCLFWNTWDSLRYFAGWILDQCYWYLK